MSRNTTDELRKILGEKTSDGYTFMLMYDVTIKRLEALISNREKLARIDELENLPWKRIDKYGINTPYVTKKWLTERKATLRKELDREEPPMSSKSDTIDEILEQLDEEYDYNNYHAGLRTAKAKLQALLLRERELGKIEVLERLMTSDPTWTYDAAKDILIDSRAELSRLSGEESHE